MADKSAASRQAAAERSAFVRAYRRLLSEERRKSIARHTSPALRNRVKKQIAGAAPAVPGTAAAARGKAVTTVPGLTARRARDTNLRRVCQALDAAGIDYFCVRGRWDRSAAVGIDARRRAAAETALMELMRTEPGYVSDVSGVGSPANLPTRSEPGREASTWAALKNATVVRLTWYHTDPRGLMVLGIPYGCDLEFWTEKDGELIAPRPNLAAEAIAADEAPIVVSESLLTGLVADGDPESPVVRTRPCFTVRRPEDVAFPVDVVYTWVDGSDPEWLRRRAAAAGEAYHEEAANAARYLSRDELRYSLRSVHQHLPWIRHIYLVTDDQVPGWLDPRAPGLTVVSHKEIFDDPSLLPTFNSHAIESRLHHIDGLSEHFLYLNDDVFIGTEVSPEVFFLGNGMTKFFPSPALVPHGEPSAAHGPVAVAAMNNRVLLQRRFGTVLTQKMKHVPHALRRSVLHEIEAEFTEEHRRTSGNRFRALDDLSIASSLHHYYAFQTGRAVPGQIRYAYQDIADPAAETRLGKLLADRDRQAFCINDTTSTEAEHAAQSALIDGFLDGYFPVPSPFERGTT